MTGASPSGTSSSSRDKNRALPPKVLHHVFVMDDFVPHIDRRAMDRQSPLHGIDGAHDSGTEPARGAKQNVEGRPGHDGAMWRDEPLSVKRDSRII